MPCSVYHGIYKCPKCEKETDCCYRYNCLSGTPIEISPGCNDCHVDLVFDHEYYTHEPTLAEAVAEIESRAEFTDTETKAGAAWVKIKGFIISALSNDGDTLEDC